MSLLTLIIDVSPPTWGHRHLLRTAQDKSQASKSKPSVGPATLDDVLTSCITLGTSFSCLHRDNTLVVIAATEEEAAVIYPRKGGEGNMENVVMGLEDKRVDGGLLGDYVKLGVAELVNRAVVKRERKEELWKKRQERLQQQSQSTQQSQSQSDPNHNQTQQAQQQSQQQLQSQSQSQNMQQKPQHKQGAAIAAALSIALCTINRFMVASHAGVSALANASDVFQRREDDGILALMSGGGNSDKSQSDDPSNDSKNNLKTNLLKPRALIVQASPDRTTDYNALMNCAFASLQSNIVIDGCFIPSGSKQDGHNAKSSPYMEQIVDQTRGVYLAVPGGAAQVGGALTEVLMSVFLPEPGRMRSMMNLPRLHSVDFRARCFESGESVDVAEVCNLCLSVFKVRPGERCWTCGALVRGKKLKGKGTGGGNNLKQDGGNSNHGNDGGLKRMRLN